MTQNKKIKEIFSQHKNVKINYFVKSANIKNIFDNTTILKKR